MIKKELFSKQLDKLIDKSTLYYGLQTRKSECHNIIEIKTHKGTSDSFPGDLVFVRMLTDEIPLFRESSRQNEFKKELAGLLKKYRVTIEVIHRRSAVARLQGGHRLRIRRSLRPGSSHQRASPLAHRR